MVDTLWLTREVDTLEFSILFNIYIYFSALESRWAYKSSLEIDWDCRSRIAPCISLIHLACSLERYSRYATNATAATTPSTIHTALLDPEPLPSSVSYYLLK
eukprot:COSAG01_NODE_1126_length_11588_cov_40.954652_2_plen_102_part_00